MHLCIPGHKVVWDSMELRERVKHPSMYVSRGIFVHPHPFFPLTLSKASVCSLSRFAHRRAVTIAAVRTGLFTPGSPYTLNGDHVSDPVASRVLWNQLAEHIIKHFYHPDLEALRVIFAAVHAHYSGGDPVWLFVIGPAGSGKTSIAINCISALPDVQVASDLTPRGFIAGKTNKSQSTLLNKKSIILAFKDFTTMISKREEHQREIVSLLREIYDGQISYRTSEAYRKWEGKATVIAAVTPAIERCWSIHRDLGERFSQIRWQNTRRPTEAARMARAQLGHEREVSAMMRAMTLDLFQSALTEPAEMDEVQGARIDAASAIIANLRRNVIRDNSTGRPIIDVPPAEEPTRLAKGFATIARHHAALFGREQVDSADMKAALRSAIDTIPALRLGILQNVPGQIPITMREIREMTGIPKNALHWHTDELEALGVLRLGQTIDSERTCAYTPDFAEIWQEADLG